MSRSLTKNYTDSGVYTITATWTGLDWATDFRVRSEKPDELILTNLTSPVDRPETFRFGHQTIANMYKNTGIDSNYYAPTVEGIKLLSALQEIWKYADDADSASNPWYLPISGTLTVNVMNVEAITADDVLSFIMRMVASFMETAKASGLINADRIMAMLRGSLKPFDM